MNLKKNMKKIGFPLYLGLFHAVFIILFGIFAGYKASVSNEEIPTLYASKFIHVLEEIF